MRLQHSASVIMGLALTFAVLACSDHSAQTGIDPSSTAVGRGNTSAATGTDETTTATANAAGAEAAAALATTVSLDDNGASFQVNGLSADTWSRQDSADGYPNGYFSAGEPGNSASVEFLQYLTSNDAWQPVEGPNATRDEWGNPMIVYEGGGEGDYDGRYWYPVVSVYKQIGDAYIFCSASILDPAFRDLAPEMRSACLSMR